MAYFAQVKDGIVVSVVAVRNCAVGGCIDPAGDPDYQADQHVDCGDLDYPESEPLGRDFLASIGLGAGWLQCSYNSRIRGCYPGLGYSYDSVADEFVPPTAPDIIP